MTISQKVISGPVSRITGGRFYQFPQEMDRGWTAGNHGLWGHLSTLTRTA